jgi:pimeloyl-ACP methyl ester carboxylesterase
MASIAVQFPSHGLPLAGDLLLPDGPGPHPVVVTCAGMSLVKEVWLPDYDRYFLENGYAVLHFDYRSFGASGGEPRRRLIPQREVEDTLAAVDFVCGRPEIDAGRVVLFGASLGCSVAVGASVDPRVRATVAVAGPGDLGRVWRSMPGFESFEAKVQAARRDFESTGEVRYISVAKLLKSDPETAAKLEAEVSRYPTWDLGVTFESLIDLFAFAPEQQAHLARALCVIQPDGDALIARVEAESIFALAREPKRLVWLEGARHVDIYGGGASVERIAREALEWFRTNLTDPLRNPNESTLRSAPG